MQASRETRRTPASRVVWVSRDACITPALLFFVEMSDCSQSKNLHSTLSLERMHGFPPFTIDVKVIYLSCVFEAEGGLDHSCYQRATLRENLKNSGLNRIWTQTSVMQVQCSSNWAFRPTGSDSSLNFSGLLCRLNSVPRLPWSRQPCAWISSSYMWLSHSL